MTYNKFSIDLIRFCDVHIMPRLNELTLQLLSAKAQLETGTQLTRESASVPKDYKVLPLT